MQKTVTYLYPDVSKASTLKIFQDKTNQIKAFYFTKENIADIEQMETSENYAVYFLFDNSEPDEQKVYVGQSMNGIKRINEHVRGKDFWTFCIMFVTDNNSFDKLSIDYLEYQFVNDFKKSSYVIMNKDFRNKEPNVSIYDKPNLMSFIKQIKFLLNAEGIVMDAPEEQRGRINYYYPRGRYDAKIYLKEGKFILEKGSKLRRPPEISKNWKSDRHYCRFNNLMDNCIKDGKVAEKEGEITTLVKLTFNAPSTIASLVSGYPENGWVFFKDLNELRNQEEDGNG